MKKTLFSNIGNRNLTYKGNYIEDYIKKEKLNEDFRSFTEKLWNNIDREKPYLEPVILNTLLDEIHEEIDEVILFSSQQKSVDRINQDTVFEGEILTYLLKGIYPGLSFSNSPFSAPVFEYNRLIRSFRKSFLSFIRENPEKPVIYCDAGGTSQQKFAAKIMLEYLFDSESLDVYYVSLGKDYKSKVEKADPYEYRKVIDKENIGIAIDVFAYDAALRILAGKNLQMKDKKEYKLIEFVSLRSKLLFNSAQKQAKNLTGMKGIQSFNFVSEYANWEPLGEYDPFKKFLSGKNFFRLCEYLALAGRNLNNENYSLAVWNFVQFQEIYCYFVIKELGYNLASNYQWEMSRLQKEAKKRFRNVAIRWPENTVPPGLPFLFEVARNVEGEMNHKVLDAFYKTNSQFNSGNGFFGLDAMRNKYAHEGEVVEKEKLIGQPYYNDILNLFKLFGMNERKIYQEMNEAINQVLQ